MSRLDKNEMMEIEEEHAGGDSSIQRYKYRGVLGLRPSLAEVATLIFWRDCVIETVITFILVFAGRMLSVSFPDNHTSGLPIAITVGFIVFALIDAFGHIQMASMNPVVTFAFVCTKRLGFIKGIMYTVFQLAGSVAANKLVYEITPEVSRGSIQPMGLGPGVTVLGGVAVEMIISAMLIFVLLGAVDEDRRPVYMAALPVGCTVAANILIGERYTGGCMNPVVTFGPAVITGIWKYQWLYWVADMSGSIIATALYILFTYNGWPINTKKASSSKEDKEAKMKMLRYSQNGEQKEGP